MPLVTGSFCQRIGASPLRFALPHLRAASWTASSSRPRAPPNGRTWSDSRWLLRGIWSWKCTTGDGCGPNPCVVGETRLSQVPAYTASWAISPSLRMHAYYLERGDRMLILRYVTGPGTEGPHAVTERTLQEMVGSLT